MDAKGGSMKLQKHISAVLGIIILFWGGSAPAQDTKPVVPTLSLTLKDCLAKAFANNLDLSIEAYNPALDDASIAASKEQYLPQFSLNYNRQNLTTLGAWGAEGTSYPYKYDFYSFNLTQKVVTGGTATLSFNNSMTDSGRAFQVINPSYNSSFQLNLTQPLLKGFGPRVNRLATLQAVNKKEVSVSALKARLIQTVYDVEYAYWSLYSSLESVKVQMSALEQSRSILKRNQEGARIGTKSAIDVLSSETEVAQYEDGLVSARLSVEQDEARLKKILNLPSDSPISAQSLFPSDKPAADKKAVSFDEALKVAFDQRPEMAQFQKELEDNADLMSYTKNQLLPELNLSFNLSSPGQSGVRYLYDNDNPFTGNIIGKITGSRLDALKQALKLTYKNWSMNVSLIVPLASVFSRANLTRVKLAQDQIKLQIDKQKQTIAYEVAGAIQNLQNAERKITSSVAARELQEKRLAAEMQRYQLGLGSIEWLLSYQRQLMTARMTEIRADIDYKLAVANLERVMGISLKSKGLKFREFEF
jgi:outer membrane protein